MFKRGVAASMGLVLHSKSGLYGARDRRNEEGGLVYISLGAQHMENRNITLNI